MVYCGKPSKGCQVCRDRRIKCDERKPTCFQCQKSRRPCPGYKDDFDLVFRNETQATERRARRAINSKKASLQKAQLKNDRQVSESRAKQAANASASFAAPIPIPVEQQAALYFLSNFIYFPANGFPGNGCMDYVYPMLRTERPGSLLRTAFSACAFAAIGNRPNSKTLLPQAHLNYQKALLSINRALADPRQQMQDQTLAAVLLLQMFEQIVSTKVNITAWGAHTGGAIELIKLRGKRQLRTQAGYAMFAAVRAQMIVSCWIGGKAPDGGVDWWLQDDDMGNPCHLQATKINLEVGQLRADCNKFMAVSRRSAEEVERVLEIMQQCERLEEDWLRWIDSLPEEWRYWTVAWVDHIEGADITKAEVCPGKVDIYPSYWLCATWNLSRVSRLIISGTIIRCMGWLCTPADYRTTPQYVSAARLGAELVSDIIASVPYNLGWHLDKPHLMGSTEEGFRYGAPNRSNPRVLGAFVGVYPFFSAYTSDFATDVQRRYLYGRLQVISREFGVNQACALSHFQLRLPSMTVSRDCIGIQDSMPSPTAVPALPAHTRAFLRNGPTIYPYYETYQGQSPSAASTTSSRDSDVDPETKEAIRRNRMELVRKAANDDGISSIDCIKGYLGVD